ncbi:hypothetical protein P3342_004165 [Pyrenophora teres f. teres]|nr:hypothetical protein P3342_004165 [Pyrenophora teres f. teres]
MPLALSCMSFAYALSYAHAYAPTSKMPVPSLTCKTTRRHPPGPSSNHRAASSFLDPPYASSRIPSFCYIPFPLSVSFPSSSFPALSNATSMAAIDLVQAATASKTRIVPTDFSLLGDDIAGRPVCP